MKLLQILVAAALSLSLVVPVQAQDPMVPVHAMRHAQKGDVEAMRTLLAENPDYVMQSSLTTDVRAITELLGMAAIAPNASLAMIELLVEAGADPDARPVLSNGQPALTPLLYALAGTVYDRPEGEKMFRDQVKLGSIPDVRATPEERLRIVQYLIDNGADPTSEMAMSNAMVAGPAYIKLLVAAGADANPVNDNGVSTATIFRKTLELYEKRLALLETHQ